MIALRTRGADALIVAVFVAAVLLASRILTGCFPESVTPSKAQAAEAAYAADHLACVDTFGTREQIDACREGVRVRWGRYRDGGAR